MAEVMEAQHTHAARLLYFSIIVETIEKIPQKLLGSLYMIDDQQIY